MPLNLHLTPRGRRAAVALSALAAPFLFFLLLDLLFPFPWEKLDRPPAVRVLDRHGEPVRFFLPADERWRFPVRLAELPPELPRALVASEDRRFHRHPGIDPLAVARAAWTNLRAGRVVSGASTIPMQIARMADPAPRTFGAKLREGFRALQLERRLSKDEILELYLNLTPQGGNLEGVGAAAWFWFGKAPAQLSLGEVALLAALPRSPVLYDPSRHPEAARAARDRVLAQLAARGAFAPAEIAEARRQPVPRRRQPPPFAAPQLAERAVRAFPGRPRLTTTLDPDTQAVAEGQVRRRIGELRSEGIGNAAVVVLDRQSRAVRALVGSAGFFEAEFQGQVDGTRARRSPGSTLKPFLYAAALDQGRVLPDSFLLDVPTDFSGYVPENFDQRYRGRVTVREALVESLNAPAVRLLAEAGLPELHRLLLRGGLATLDRPAEHYGLSLVLGGGEVTLLDLTNLYATLGEGGLHRPVRLLEGPEGAPISLGPGERLLSREAARVVTEVLLELRRPDLPESWDLARGAPAVAWKTGTSYGHRDAWAVGFSQGLAAGVWVGNFDGTPVQGISGSRHAAPLLFDLFRALEPAAGGGRPRRPPGLRLGRIEVCPESRALPGASCPRRLEVTYLPGRSRLAACAVHRQVMVDAKTGERLSGDCLRGRRHRFQRLTLHPAELAAWWRSQGVPVDEMPPLAPGCRGAAEGEPPRIVSPDPATPYRLRRDTPAEHQRIPLSARTDPAARRLYWYQDGVLVAAAAPGEHRFLEPVPGEHRLVATDDLGRTDAVTYRVEAGEFPAPR